MKLGGILIFIGIIAVMGICIAISESTIKKNGGHSEWIGEPIHDWIEDIKK